MHKCYICQCELDSNNSADEHILLNAIGGRIKSKNLLCRKCNSEFGDDCDAELASQLAPLTSFLQVKKQRGNINPIDATHTVTGEKYVIQDGYKPAFAKPVFEQNREGDNIRLKIRARGKNEFEKMLKGLKRKYPNLDIDAILADAEFVEEYLDAPLRIGVQVGNDLAFRSIAKTAVNFYLYNGGNRQEIVDILPYLKGEANLEVVAHHVAEPLSYTETDGEILHVLHLVGDHSQKLLYCYIEFFSSFTFIVQLSNEYAGPDLNSNYAFDVRTNTPKEKIVRLSLDQAQLNAILASRPGPPLWQTVTRRLTRVIGYA